MAVRRSGSRSNAPTVRPNEDALTSSSASMNPAPASTKTRALAYWCRSGGADRARIPRANQQGPVQPWWSLRPLTSPRQPPDRPRTYPARTTPHGPSTRNDGTLPPPRRDRFLRTRAGSATDPPGVSRRPGSGTTADSNPAPLAPTNHHERQSIGFEAKPSRGLAPVHAAEIHSHRIACCQSIWKLVRGRGKGAADRMRHGPEHPVGQTGFHVLFEQHQAQSQGSPGQDTGTAPYPPSPMTALARNCRRTWMDRPTISGSRAEKSALPARPRGVFNPVRRRVAPGARSRTRLSTRFDPRKKRNSASGLRCWIARATWIPGTRWPPEPPPANTTLGPEARPRPASGVPCPVGSWAAPLPSPSFIPRSDRSRDTRSPCPGCPTMTWPGLPAHRRGKPFLPALAASPRPQYLFSWPERFDPHLVQPGSWARCCRSSRQRAGMLICLPGRRFRSSSVGFSFLISFHRLAFPANAGQSWSAHLPS